MTVILRVSILMRG